MEAPAIDKTNILVASEIRWEKIGDTIYPDGFLPIHSEIDFFMLYEMPGTDKFALRIDWGGDDFKRIFPRPNLCKWFHPGGRHKVKSGDVFVSEYVAWVPVHHILTRIWDRESSEPSYSLRYTWSFTNSLKKYQEVNPHGYAELIALAADDLSRQPASAMNFRQQMAMMIFAQNAANTERRPLTRFFDADAAVKCADELLLALVQPRFD